MERQYLGINDSMTLIGRKTETFRILYRLDYRSEGSSVLCYEAESERLGRGVLKEFYPMDAVSLERNEYGQLVHKRGMGPEKRRFEAKLDRYLEHYNRTVFNACKNSEISKMINSFDIYRGIDYMGRPSGTVYIWALYRYHTFDTLCRYSAPPEKYLLDVLRAVESLVKAVMILHRNGYVHRDIKPSNFGFIQDSSSYISFFDVDTLYCVDQTEDFTAVSSYGFSEPESAYERPCNLTDIYSIGATLLYAICCGKFSLDNSIAEIVSSAAPIKDIRSDGVLADKLTDTLMAILKRSLCLRETRYQCCEELLDDIHIALDHSSALAKETEEKNARLDRLRDVYHRENGACIGVTDYHAALSAENLPILFTPEVDLSTGRIIGAEASCPAYKAACGRIPYSPSHIDGYLTSSAIRSAVSWQMNGLEPIIISVRTESCDWSYLFKMICQYLYRSNLDPRWFEFLISGNIEEIERMRNSDINNKYMYKLRSIGVNISVDTVGMRLFPITSLADLPVTSLRLGRDMIESPEDNTSVYDTALSWIRIARSQKIHLTAEGVATPQQEALFRKLGCDQGMGPLYDELLTAEEMTALLKNK